MATQNAFSIKIGKVECWYDLKTTTLTAHKEDGKRVEDLRKNSPYLCILPCPYCGSLKEFEHDKPLHIDARLGVKI